MPGVDRQDQMLSHYPLEENNSVVQENRDTNIPNDVDQCIHPEFYMYSGGKKSLYEFRLAMIRHLLSSNTTPTMKRKSPTIKKTISQQSANLMKKGKLGESVAKCALIENGIFSTSSIAPIALEILDFVWNRVLDNFTNKNICVRVFLA